MGWEVLEVFEEKISGGKLNEERPQLMKMVHLVEYLIFQQILSIQDKEYCVLTIVLEETNLLPQHMHKAHTTQKDYKQHHRV